MGRFDTVWVGAGGAVWALAAMTLIGSLCGG
jgi:hypothetical protein